MCVKSNFDSFEASFTQLFTKFADVVGFKDDRIRF